MDLETSSAPGAAVRNLRLARGETLEQFGLAIGVASKGRMSELERGLRQLTPEQALAVERVSNGTVNAADLNDLVAEARKTAPDVSPPAPSTGETEAGEDDASAGAVISGGGAA
jgi:transcriptional regulator with XRE-family HTH domain